MPPADPVLIRIRRGKSLWMAALIGIFGLLWCLMCLGVLLLDVSISLGLLLTTAIGVAFTLMGLWHLGIALKHPVALRMDAHGISGFYIEPATWAEVKTAFTFSTHNNHRALGFELRDPIGFRDRQSPWRRYRSWASGRAYKAHLVVPQILLADADVTDLATQAKALHSKATSA